MLRGGHLLPAERGKLHWLWPHFPRIRALLLEREGFREYGLATETLWPALSVGYYVYGKVFKVVAAHV
jgi:hypothetical protein